MHILKTMCARQQYRLVKIDRSKFQFYEVTPCTQQPKPPIYDRSRRRNAIVCGHAAIAPGGSKWFHTRKRRECDCIHWPGSGDSTIGSGPLRINIGRFAAKHIGSRDNIIYREEAV